MTAPYRNVFGYDNTESIYGPGLTADMYGFDHRAAPDPKVQELIDSGVITQNVQNFSNESGEGTLATNQVDWSRMPERGKQGMLRPGEWWIPAHENAINPGMTYDDPNYGPMTADWNNKANLGDWKDYIGPAIMALVTMGASSLPVAAGMSAAASAGAGAGAGAWAGAGAAGAAAGEAVLPVAGLYGVQSVPWWANTGLSLAKTVGKALTAEKPAPAPTYPGTSLPVDYLPSNFGNSSGTPPALSTGSAPVATSVAPNAYAQSHYNQVIG